MIVLSTVVACPVKTDFILSTTSTEGLGGLTLQDGDLVEYDLATDTATILLLGFGSLLLGHRRRA